MSTAWDVVVVGGRAAGASTALLLARAGLRVLCLERTRLGSDTLSTHALMRGGTLQLKRWGLLDRVAAAGTPAIRSTHFHYGRESVSVSIRPAHGVDALYAPRRTLLDRMLVEAAREAGATMRFGTTVVGLDTHPSGQVTGLLVRDRGGEVRRESAGLVIGADGRNSFVAEAVGAATTTRGRHSAGCMYGYVEGMSATGYEWFYGSRASAGVIPTNDGLTCVFVAAPTPRMEALVSALGPRRAFQTLADATALGEQLRSVPFSGGLRHMRGLPGYLRQSSGPGWALVGDAGSWKDPMSTHGMSDAFRDAELLARAVVAAPSPGSAQRFALDGYASQRDALARPMLEVTEQLASFAWDLHEVRQLLLQLASVMTDDLEVLAALDPAA